MPDGLVLLSSGKFCVTYDDKGIYIIWKPGDAAYAEKLANRINVAHPNEVPVPERTLKDVIGSRARFSEQPGFEGRGVEFKGHLDDGGTIVIGYAKEDAAKTMSDDEREAAIAKLRAWQRSHLPHDV